MTDTRTAYHAGIWDTLLAADGAAAAIRSRPDAQGIRQMSAVEALDAFSEAFRTPLAGTPKRRP